MSAWVLYDASCGFCRTWAPAWGDRLRRRGIGVAALQSDWVSRQLDMAAADLLQDILLLTKEGRVIRGANVYRYVLRRIWWLSPVYLLASAPGLSRLFDFAYRTFAENRYQISRSCGLTNPAKLSQ